MYLLSTILSVAVLWFLITYYSRTTRSSSTLQEAWIVIIGVSVIDFVSRLALGSMLGALTGIIPIVALYLLVDKICDLDRRATIRICLCYVVVMVIIGVFMHLISMPVDA